MNKIRILVVEPNQAPYKLKVNNNLKGLHGVVEGLIEYVELEHNIDLVCNEEFLMLALPMNRIVGETIIFGTFFIAGYNEEGETILLSKKQIKKYKKIFKYDNGKKLREFFRDNIISKL